MERNGWYADNIADLKKIAYKDGKKGQVDIANTPARIIVQTFSPSGLQNLKKAFPRLIPMLFLTADTNATPITYAEKINFAIETGATIFGPNIDYIKGYPSSVMPWEGDMIRRSGLDIHAWSFNTQEQYLKYTGPWCDPTQTGGAEKNYIDGSFTNLTDLALNFYRTTLQDYADKGKNYFRSNAKVGMEDNIHKNKTVKTAQEVLDELGY